MGLQILFFKVLELSITASVIVLIILLLRAICGKIFSSRFIYLLWLILILKLVVPFSIPSPFSLENVTDKYIYERQNSIISMGNLLDGTVQGLVKTKKAIGIYDDKRELLKSDPVYIKGKPTVDTKTISDPALIELSRYSSSMKFLLTLLSLTWFIGFISSIAVKFYRNLKFKKFFIKHNYCEDIVIIKLFNQCKRELGVTKNIRVLMCGSTMPMMYGILKPCILLPYDCKSLFDDEELRYIMLHELEHYKQKDTFLFWIGDILKAMHWFNPIINIGINKMQDDCEVLCDLHVMQHIKNEERINYGMLLIKQGEINYTNFNLNTISASLLGRKTQLNLRIRKIANMRFLRLNKKQYSVGFCIIVLMALILLPVNKAYSQRVKYIDTQPTIYAFWMKDNVNVTSLDTINSMTIQMLGNQSDNKDVVLIMKDFQDVSIDKYSLLVEQTWPLSKLAQVHPVEIHTQSIRNEVKKRGMGEGKIYIFLSCNMGYTKYLSTSVGMKTILDYESLDSLDKVKLY